MRCKRCAQGEEWTQSEADKNRVLDSLRLLPGLLPEHQAHALQSARLEIAYKAGLQSKTEVVKTSGG